MPTSYTGRETDDESPDKERATQRKPMQTMQAGQPAQSYIGRTFQPQPGPASTPGQASPMPWTSQLGGAGRSESTPWAQGGGGTQMPQMQSMGMDSRAFSMDPEKNRTASAMDAANSAYLGQQRAQQSALQGFNQAQGAQSINAQMAANNAAMNRQNAAMNQANQLAQGGMGGGMQIGGGPDWGALAARFGGGQAQSPVQFGGGTQQGGGLGGGNPWLQQMLSGLAQRFAGLQRGGAPQGSAQPSSRLWQGPGRR